MMANLTRRRSAWNWSTRRKWLALILAIKVLVEHRRHHVLVVIVSHSVAANGSLNSARIVALTPGLLTIACDE